MNELGAMWGAILGNVLGTGIRYFGIAAVRATANELIDMLERMASDPQAMEAVEELVTKVEGTVVNHLPTQTED